MELVWKKWRPRAKERKGRDIRFWTIKFGPWHLFDGQDSSCSLCNEEIPVDLRGVDISQREVPYKVPFGKFCKKCLKKWRNLHREQLERNKMCPTYSLNATYGFHNVSFKSFGRRKSSLKVDNKRQRIICPTCGRRVLARISLCHDGCCISYLLPPHKQRAWWKRKYNG